MTVMTTTQTYRGPQDCPQVVPLFPLAGTLLLPRGQLPLNIFEPRYLAMIDDALAGRRTIGIIQPEDEETVLVPRLYTVGCAGRITQFAETGDGRYVISLTGISRFRVKQELTVTTPYRQAQVDFGPFKLDFEARAGETEVDRDGVIRTLRAFAKANDLKVDWKGINEAPNEALVNALAMMSPFGTREKQALLEAQDLKARAEMLIAITEIELARDASNPDSILQ
jgi:Lon protease-like protein